MIKVAVIGGSGYAGQNIIKLLLNHKKAEIIYVVSTSQVGEREPQTGLLYDEFDPLKLNLADVVFVAVPHGAALEMCSKISTRVIDVSADHRLTHTYGLPEVNYNEIKTAKLLANPGCYATASILSVYPIKEHISHVVFDGISGYSGAGKNAKEKFDIEENVIAYQLTKHFHINEIEKTLGCPISFTPHVVNNFAGLMITAHIFLKDSFLDNLSLDKRQDLIKHYSKFYEGTFTHIIDGVPCTKEVVNTPFCKIGGFEFDKHGSLVVVSVIDNLLKGAASQAIENMNIMFNLEYSYGLINY